jgi:hypothetical protein
MSTEKTGTRDVEVAVADVQPFGKSAYRSLKIVGDTIATPRMKNEVGERQARRQLDEIPIKADSIDTCIRDTDLMTRHDVSVVDEYSQHAIDWVFDTLGHDFESQSESTCLLAGQTPKSSVREQDDSNLHKRFYNVQLVEVASPNTSGLSDVFQRRA